MILHAVGGLCNRLLAILSYRAVYGAIDVVWDRDEPVSGGDWADVFKPLPRVTFVSGGASAQDFSSHHDAPAGWRAAYAELAPSDKVERRVGNALSFLGTDFVAVHMRRTDARIHAERDGIYEDDDAYIEWVRTRSAGSAPSAYHEWARASSAPSAYHEWARASSVPSAYHEWARASSVPRLPSVYLATDNGETQARMVRALADTHCVAVSETLSGTEAQDEHDHHRNGPLAAAVTDLYVCSCAREFKGSARSTFSEAIEILRGLKKV